MPPFFMKSLLTPAWCADSTVMCRIDLNLDPDHPGEQFRFQALMPTFKVLRVAQVPVLLLTHRGRPNGVDERLSNRLLLPLFINAGIPVRFAQTLEEAALLLQQPGFVLLENTRFFEGEHPASVAFAQQLRTLGDAYVFDAFASAASDDASVMLLPQLFAPHRRTIGLLVERELQALNLFLQAPAAQTAVLMAGGKPDTKTAYVEAFSKRGCQVFTAPLLDGVYQHNMLTGVQVPVDYLVSTEGFVATSMAVVPVAAVGSSTILSIGPVTAHHYLERMGTYQYLLINGIAGDYMQPAMTLLYQQLLTQLIAQPHTAVIAGGGDTAAPLQLWGLADKLNYLSTGGGAFLAYLATGTLPFLKWR